MRSTRRLTAAACAGMFLFGVVMAVLGAVLPVLSARLRIDMSEGGGLFVAMNLAMLAASLTLGPAMDRAGLKAPLVGGPLLVMAALAGLARATSYGELLVSMAALGYGGGALNAAANTLVADLHDEPKGKNAALNLLGVFFGIGALFIPFQMATLLERWGLTRILDGAALLCGLVAVFAFTMPFPAPKQRAGATLAGLGKLLRAPLVLVWGALLFFQSGNEFVLGGYASTFLVSQFGATVETASYVLAGYWAALMAARLILSRVLLRVPGHTLILVCAAVASLGAAVTAGAGTRAGAMASLALTGFSLAGIFPTVLGLAGAQFRELSGTAFGILFTMGLTGGISLPWWAGQIAEGSGARGVFYLAAAGFSAIFCLQLAAGRLRSRE